MVIQRMSVFLSFKTWEYWHVPKKPQVLVSWMWCWTRSVLLSYLPKLFMILCSIGSVYTFRNFRQYKTRVLFLRNIDGKRLACTFSFMWRFNLILKKLTEKERYTGVQSFQYLQTIHTFLRFNFILSKEVN